MNIKNKICALCGREIEYRKKWEKDWEQIKYCSSKCRNTKITNNYEELILSLLKQRGAGKSICPSEILEDSQKKNKLLMEEVRQAARRLVAKNQIEITQNSKVVDPSKAKGPIRLRLIRS